MASHLGFKRGAKMLHIADLDGAFQGRPANLEKVAKMKKSISVPIQMGGGFRSMESIDAALGIGVDRVILGTAAVYNPELVVHGSAICQVRRRYRCASALMCLRILSPSPDGKSYPL